MTREELIVYLVEKARGRRELGLSVAETLTRITHMAVLHGARDSYVEQAALLLYLGGTHAHLAGEEVLLHADDIYNWELQSLGRMDGH